MPSTAQGGYVASSMARRRYEGHSDFYLRDLWQARDSLPDGDRAALVEEMSLRRLDDATEAPEADPYRGASQAAPGALVCPACQEAMTSGEARLWTRERDFAQVQFRRNEHGDETVAFEHSQWRPARLCEGCGSVLLLGRFAG